MIESTTDYDKFKFRDDNREGGISKSHLEKLMRSIQSKNLLKMCPISVNQDFEVIDGQHRLMAAKKLGLEIYYQVKKDLDPKDMILMNVSKGWSIADYLNYYNKNGYIEYQKLSEFIKRSQLPVKVALYMTISKEKVSLENFKNGDYVFKLNVDDTVLKNCWDTVHLIIKNNGYSPYTKTSKFWNALIKLCAQPNFNFKKWVENISRMSDRCGPRTTTSSFFTMLVDIYNWRNPDRICVSE